MSPTTDPLLARLCSRHREAGRCAAKAGRLLAPWLERLTTTELCTRCGLAPRGHVSSVVSAELATLCISCRDVRRRGSSRSTRIDGSLRPQTHDRRRTGLRPTPEERAEADAEIAQHQRPRVRGDCLPGGCNAQRPCPWVSCRWHLALDVTRAGGLRVTWPGRDVTELEHTCALDEADAGEHSLEDTGKRCNLTRERLRQLEVEILGAMRPRMLRRLGLEAPRARRHPEAPAREERPLDAAWLAHATRAA